MVVEAADRTQGYLAENGWDAFEITDKGAAQLENKDMPKDIGEQLSKPIAATTKTYRICETTYKVMAAVC